MATDTPRTDAEDHWRVDQSPDGMLYVDAVRADHARDLESENATLRAELASVTQERNNLLARIHRDGGHYLAEHGAAKATADADAIVATAFAERDARQAAIDEWAIATDESVRLCGTDTGAWTEEQWQRAEDRVSERVIAAENALTALATPANP